MLFEKTEVQLVSNAIMNMLHEEEMEIVNNFHDAVIAKDTAMMNSLKSYSLMWKTTFLQKKR